MEALEGLVKKKKKVTHMSSPIFSKSDNFFIRKTKAEIVMWDMISSV